MTKNTQKKAWQRSFYHLYKEIIQMKRVEKICWLCVIAVLIGLHISNYVEIQHEIYQTDSMQSAEYETAANTKETYLEQLNEASILTEETESVPVESEPADMQEETETGSETAETVEELPESIPAITYPAYYGGCGTVKSIRGKTVVVTVFASDQYCAWDWDKKSDLDTYSNMYRSILEAEQWLEAEASYWGAYTDLIVDWMSYNELYYEAYFDQDMLGDGISTFAPMADYVKAHIDAEGLMEQFDADNITFIFCFNGKHTDKTWAYAYPLFGKMPESDCYYETILLNCGHPSYILKAATIAHELLHTFGLPDMYYANERINEDYVNHLREIESDEIMYDHSRWDWWGTQPHFTQLDAYYLGLCDDADDLHTYQLDPDIYCE